MKREAARTQAPVLTLTHFVFLDPTVEPSGNIMNCNALNTHLQQVIRRTELALAAYARGEFVLVSDDEDRENEGDLIIAADYADAIAVNFMITHGRGLVCLAISPEI